MNQNQHILYHYLNNEGVIDGIINIETDSHHTPQVVNDVYNELPKQDVLDIMKQSIVVNQQKRKAMKDMHLLLKDTSRRLLFLVDSLAVDVDQPGADLVVYDVTHLDDMNNLSRESFIHTLTERGEDEDAYEIDRITLVNTQDVTHLPYNYQVPIGGWSRDGHGNLSMLTVQTNKPKEDIQQAYLAFEAKHRITLDTNPWLRHKNENLREAITDEWTHLLNAYEDCRISLDMVEQLKTIGIDVEIFKNYLDYHAVSQDVRDEMTYIIVMDEKEVAKLFMEMAKTECPDLAYTVTDVDNESCLFGYWDSGLNIQAGYGVMSD